MRMVRSKRTILIAGIARTAEFSISVMIVTKSTIVLMPTMEKSNMFQRQSPLWKNAKPKVRMRMSKSKQKIASRAKLPKSRALPSNPSTTSCVSRPTKTTLPTTMNAVNSSYAVLLAKTTWYPSRAQHLPPAKVLESCVMNPPVTEVRGLAVFFLSGTSSSMRNRPLALLSNLLRGEGGASGTVAASSSFAWAAFTSSSPSPSPLVILFKRGPSSKLSSPSGGLASARGVSCCFRTKD
mmetsp:Transcript_61198/g.177455  ORF Transcript_61198/g.177455 Transcript_61198/m.177455 type:complete len:238 (+) Transcript_61198:1052-1765(+)